MILPSGMVKHMPFVYIKNNGRGRIEIRLAKGGILTRIYNYIDSFEKHLKIFENNLKISKNADKTLQKNCPSTKIILVKYKS